MNAIASLIQDMIAAGVNAELIGRTAALLAEREAVVVPDEQAERRRLKDRERKRLRNSAESAEFRNSAPPIKEKSPEPSKENYPLSSEPSVPRCDSARRHAWPEDFKDRVWSIYPRKTEKQPGMAALVELHRKDRLDWQTLLDGIHRLAAAIEDPKFAPALHRWLKKARWDDQHPESLARAGPVPRRTYGQIVREAVNEIAGQDDDQQPDRQAEFSGPTLDLVAGSGGADIVDLHSRRTNGLAW